MILLMDVIENARPRHFYLKLSNGLSLVMTGLFFFFFSSFVSTIGNKRLSSAGDGIISRAPARRLSYTRFAITSFRFRQRARDRGGYVFRGCPSRRRARGERRTAVAAAMFAPTSAFRRFSESPKHPIDCPTSFAGTRELVHRSPPVPPRFAFLPLASLPHPFSPPRLPSRSRH